MSRKWKAINRYLTKTDAYEGGWCRGYIWGVLTGVLLLPLFMLAGL